MANSNLANAKRAKNDEFYTQSTTPQQSCEAISSSINDMDADHVTAWSKKSSGLYLYSRTKVSGTAHPLYAAVAAARKNPDISEPNQSE
ncbi:MAG: hypothetical protein Q8L52_00305 [bacterium]|nr:hypothetical protein [bacterium]